MEGRIRKAGTAQSGWRQDFSWFNAAHRLRKATAAQCETTAFIVGAYLNLTSAASGDQIGADGRHPLSTSFAMIAETVISRSQYRIVLNAPGAASSRPRSMPPSPVQRLMVRKATLDLILFGCKFISNAQQLLG